MAQLSYAILIGADLSEAWLDQANLSGADLSYADLSEAWLDQADLSGANFIKANLSGAKLHLAKLKRAIFQPKDLPEVDGIASATDLSEMRLASPKEFKDPQAMVKLRKAKAVVLGVYFSILSAFNIGWRELNVGNWIQRLQANEYTLKATGWIRPFTGVQSLISAYLLAIWALTYFGRPFERE